ncbi:DUF982 domain-containing protein [Mesorhizobium sp. B2-7-1]|uniref:DUF982 domain-containing protein n=1 Tax=Mesorhizobium sp. B2-7-1 TaxID=2589909 RepID=UPI0015E323F8|nr:DUF982 domain-containing protein [Mesorhizobium sp. B2-7-1]
MPDFLPLTVKFPGSSQPTVVCNLAEAAATLGKRWPNRASNDYVRAADLLGKAMAGDCAPRVAFEAYRIAAGQQRLLMDTSRSAALQVLDSLAGESMVVSPDPDAGALK